MPLYLQGTKAKYSNKVKLANIPFIEEDFFFLGKKSTNEGDFSENKGSSSVIKQKPTQFYVFQRAYNSAQENALNILVWEREGNEEGLCGAKGRELMVDKFIKLFLLRDSPFCVIGVDERVSKSFQTIIERCCLKVRQVRWGGDASEAHPFVLRRQLRKDTPLEGAAPYAVRPAAICKK
ncbi:hypothetical protein TNCV_4944971 [Trichonephila clavipes]|nr:hypothetical protein TNCV_4944971 [Trichonephila clavipes]